MKIRFQNPTQGPLITVSFDDEVTDVAKAFSLIGASRVTAAANNGLATLRAAAQFSEVAPGAGGSAASIAGPLALIGMFFAAGDSPQRETTTEEIVQHSPSPAELRCLSNPYDSSAECATMRSILTALPFLESPSTTPNAARATAAFTTTSSVPMAVGLPTSITQFAADLLAHIEASDGKRHAVPLSADEKQDLIALAQKVAAGEASDFDLGLHVWELLEGDLLRPLEAKGFVVDLIDTPDGPVYAIQWSGANNLESSWAELPLERRWRELRKVEDAYTRILPRFNQLVASRDTSTTLLPSSRYLLHILPSLREKIQFVVGDLTADEFHNYHAHDLSPVQVPLTRHIWLQDLSFWVHGLSMLLHDIWHALLWEGQSPAVKAMALQLYPRINAIMQDFPEHVRYYLDLVVETIVQPPLEMGATSTNSSTGRRRIENY